MDKAGRDKGQGSAFGGGQMTGEGAIYYNYSMKVKEDFEEERLYTDPRPNLLIQIPYLGLAD